MEWVRVLGRGLGGGEVGRGGLPVQVGVCRGATVVRREEGGSMGVSYLLARLANGAACQWVSGLPTPLFPKYTWPIEGDRSQPLCIQAVVSTSTSAVWYVTIHTAVTCWRGGHLGQLVA